MKVTLILNDLSKGGIIEKMARRLAAALCDLGVSASVSNTRSADSAVNHYMIFHYADAISGTLNTMGVTHVDDALKIDIIRARLHQSIRAAICMSSMTVEQLVNYGINRCQLTYALPAHDEEVQPRRVIIGITSNIYPDGRKREWLLTKLASELTLDDFEFQIFGSGWESVVPRLIDSGAKVTLHTPTSSYEADYMAVKQAIPYFDYYFYPGLDEGSMGTLDALSAGIKTIITRQGFHLDIPNGMTHGFWGYEELRTIMETISEERGSRFHVARAMTWKRYAQRHVDIWSSLLTKNELPPVDTLTAQTEKFSSRDAARQSNEAYPMLSYRELLMDPYRRDMAVQFWIPRSFLRMSYGLARLMRLTRGAI